jgi:hypothetical protein
MGNNARRKTTTIFYERVNPMKANKINESGVYEVKVGKNTTTVKVLSVEERMNGTTAFLCENTKTGKPLTVTDAGRFVKAVKPAATPKAPRIREDGTMSIINAAYKVLSESGAAMTSRQIYEAVTEAGLCVFNGLTPTLTVSGILQLDIKNKGKDSRFCRPGRGLFAAR